MGAATVGLLRAIPLGPALHAAEDPGLYRCSAVSVRCQRGGRCTRQHPPMLWYLAATGYRLPLLTVNLAPLQNQDVVCCHMLVIDALNTSSNPNPLLPLCLLSVQTCAAACLCILP